ncbi:MAG: SAM-dependent methyltransferase [Ilumatobacteraceae bacterium]
MPSAADPVAELAARQTQLGRPLRFDEYLDVALYGSSGFYSLEGRAGRRGDFLTSPEVGPLFGAVVARWIDAEFDRLADVVARDDLRVIEVGAGPGTLARAVLQAAPHLGGRYVAVEVSAAQRAHHPAGVSSVADMPDGEWTGVVLANELLDNLPFRLAVHDGTWREAAVHVEPSGAVVEVLLPAPSEWHWLPASAPHGARVPVQTRAHDWVAGAQRRLRAGTVLAIDYCTSRTATLATVPWRQWLRTYRGHERGAHYLRDIGLQDVTAQVCVDQLPEPDAVRTQAQFLRRWGIDELVDEGRAAWDAAASRPDLAALRMRSRIAEAESLLDPDGLGGFEVLEWRTRGDGSTVHHGGIALY